MSRYIDIETIKPRQYENSEVELGVLAYDYDEVDAMPSAQETHEERTETHACDLISRQAAIDAICTEGTRLERNGTVAMAEIKQWCVDILDALPSAQPEPITVNIDHELTQEDYEKLRKDVANAPIMLLPSAQQWTPCSERLPEEEKEVFVYLFGDSPYIAWVDKNGVWNTEDFEVDDDNRPVAWMSLPKPYKGEQE